MPDTSDPSPSNQNGLRTRDMSVRFGDDTVLDSANLGVDRDHILGVIGPSGSGKTTLLHAIAGTVPLAGGFVWWNGHDITAVPPHKRGFALMFQRGQLFNHLTVERNIAYPMRRVSRSARHDRVRELLDLVGLSDVGRREPATLSGGQQQRVALARALAAAPKMLLLDEPFSALDRALARGLAADLRRIIAETRTPTVVVSHAHDDVWSLATHLAIVDHGRIVQSGDVSTVWQAPVNANAATTLGYATVMSRATANRLAVATADDVGTRWGRAQQIAIRRSALVLSTSGLIAGTIRDMHSDQDVVRLVVDIPHVGELPAVAPHGHPMSIGASAQFTLDATKTAPVGAP